MELPYRGIWYRGGYRARLPWGGGGVDNVQHYGFVESRFEVIRASLEKRGFGDERLPQWNTVA